jgi:putative endopeptidase
MGAPPSAPQPAQDLLSQNIDPAVSPREDFFRYAGGGWLNRNPIPEDQAGWGGWNVASDEIYARLRTISENAAAKKAGRGTAEQLVGDVWATGMDSAAINQQGLVPLKPDLDRIGAIRSVRDLIDVVAMLHRRNMLWDNFFVRQRVLFDDGVERDQANSHLRIYSLSQGGLTMGRLAYSATDPPRVKVQNAFREYLFRTFLRLHGDSGKARASARAVFDLEAGLAAGFEQGNQSRRMRPADLSELAPGIDWSRYFRQIGATGIDSVDLRQPGFFRALDALLRAVPLETWKDYLQFWLVKTNAPFLDDGTYSEFFAYKSTVTGQLQPEPRWRRLVWQLKNWLGLPLAKLYVDADLPPNARSRYRAVAESIRQAFRDRVEHLDWMSDSTKDRARLKLDRLKITIGYPERWIDFSTMPLRRDSYVQNMIRSAEWFHDREIRSLSAAVDRGETGLHPSIGGDAEYLDSSNEVRVSNPTPPGLRGQRLDDAIVYGATWLGHEIAHALDSEGRHYDAEGNRVDWWTAADTEAFEGRAQVLVDQYNDLMPIEGLHIDGRGTLRENMADLVGLRIALDAFKKTDQFKKNERVGGFTPLQRFFLAYAYARMGHERPESLATRLRGGGGYAPARERVNGVVMNIPEFYEAFGVQPGDPMYRPERARAKVW